LVQPAVDLLPALPSHEVAAEPSRPLAPGGPPSEAAVREDNSAGAASPPARDLTPPAGDGAVQRTSFDPDALPPLPLPEAIRLALQNTPRLRAALAAIERAAGQEQAAFAPFLPQIDLLNRYVATGKSTVPGAPGPTGAVNPSVIGHYQVYQSELQLQWTLYDFGRTAGRYRQAAMRESITRLQALRARETVAYDVATA